MSKRDKNQRSRPSPDHQVLHERYQHLSSVRKRRGNENGSSLRMYDGWRRGYDLLIIDLIVNSESLPGSGITGLNYCRAGEMPLMPFHYFRFLQQHHHDQPSPAQHQDVRVSRTTSLMPHLFFLYSPVYDDYIIVSLLLHTGRERGHRSRESADR